MKFEGIQFSNQMNTFGKMLPTLNFSLFQIVIKIYITSKCDNIIHYFGLWSNCPLLWNVIILFITSDWDQILHYFEMW